MDAARRTLNDDEKLELVTEELIASVGRTATLMRLSSGRTAPIPATVEAPGATQDDELTAAFAQAWSELGSDLHPRLVVVGVPVGAPAQRLGEDLQLHWPDALVTVVDEGVLAHAAACGGLGVMASLDTGSLILGLDGAGDLHRVDGWGPDLGDRGSAFELGRQGLVSVLEAADDMVAPTMLSDHAVTWLAGLGMERLDARFIHSLARDPGRVEAIAGFADDVLRAAGEDDAVAAQLVSEAAVRVAQGCAAAAQKCGQSMVALRGRLSESRVYVTALELALQRFELEVVRARGDLLDVSADLFFTSPYQDHVLWSTPAAPITPEAQALT